MEPIVVYLRRVAGTLEGAVEYDVVDGSFLVATLAYDVEWLEILFEPSCVLSCKGVTNSQP